MQIEKCEYAAQEKVWHSFSGQLPTPFKVGLRRSSIPPNLFTSHTFVARFWRNFTLLIDILPLFCCSTFDNSNVPVLIFTNKPIGQKDRIAILDFFSLCAHLKVAKDF